MFRFAMEFDLSRLFYQLGQDLTQECLKIPSVDYFLPNAGSHLWHSNRSFFPCHVKQGIFHNY